MKNEKYTYLNFDSKDFEQSANIVNQKDYIVNQKAHIVSLSAKDYGLADHPDSFKAAKEINAAIIDAIETKCLSYEGKLLSVYQTMRKHKRLGAVNQNAIDKVEAMFFLHGIEPPHKKTKPIPAQNNNAGEKFFFATLTGAAALVFAATAGVTLTQSIIVAVCVMMVVGWGSWVLG